jgi:hypothetical protein
LRRRYEQQLVPSNRCRKLFEFFSTLLGVSNRNAILRAATHYQAALPCATEGTLQYLDASLEQGVHSVSLISENRARPC